MRVRKIIGKLFNYSKARVKIAAPYVEMPIPEGRILPRQEKNWWLIQNGILTPVSRKTRYEIEKECKEVFSRVVSRPH